MRALDNAMQLGDNKGYERVQTGCRGGGSYGSEIDLSWGRAIPGVKGLTGLAKLARYRSDDPGRTPDTDKVWLQLQYAY